MSCVNCHLSYVTFVSGVKIHIYIDIYIFSSPVKPVEQVGGGSVINVANPVYFAYGNYSSEPFEFIMCAG